MKVREELMKFYYGTITLEYDNEKFAFIHLREDGKLVLKRLQDQKVLKVFDDVGFIIEHDINGRAHFVVSTQKDDKPLLQHYIEWEYLLGHPQLRKMNTFSVRHIDEQSCRIQDHFYEVEQDDKGACLYNLERKSPFYQELYRKKEILKLFKTPTVLVSREMFSRYNPDIKDKVTYGINLDTLCIATPMYSELQQRFIPIKTQDKMGYTILEEKREASMLDDIETTIDLLELYLEQEKSVYLDDQSLNQQFVRKFTKKS